MRHLHAPRLFTVAALVACATLITPIVAPRPAAAQDASNVVPDGGAGAMSGTIRSIDFQTREVVVTPRAGGRPHTFHAPPHVNIAGYMAGVDVNVHFTRTVNIRVTPATPGSAAPTAPGATTTVGQVLGPAGFGDGAAEVVASVVRVNPPNEVIVANATGGGEQVIHSTVPARQALIKTLKPGDRITVTLSELTLTSIIACGLFRCL